MTDETIDGLLQVPNQTELVGRLFTRAELLRRGWISRDISKENSSRATSHWAITTFDKSKSHKIVVCSVAKVNPAVFKFRDFDFLIINMLDVGGEDPEVYILSRSDYKKLGFPEDEETIWVKQNDFMQCRFRKAWNKIG